MTNKTIRIFGVPMDLGQNRRGVDMGPSAVRYANLHTQLRHLGYVPEDEGNITVTQAEQAPEIAPLPINAHFLPQVAQVCRATYERLNACWEEGDFGLFIGGDHSISIATVTAAAERGLVGVLWVDAHTDINTPESSPSGNIHGMSVAVLLGDGPADLVNIGKPGAAIQSEQVAMIGVRDVDETEKKRVAESGIQVYTMRDLDEKGIANVAARVLKKFAHMDHIHVSFDLDSMDPRHAPGVGTPVMGGLTYREAHLLMEILADSGKVRSMDVVEINPILDNQNQTASIAIEMILSLLGKQILPR